MGNNRTPRVAFNCHQCGSPATDRASHYAKKVKHFCCNVCYWKWRSIAPPSEQPTWRGGVSSTEAHRRWKAKNPERMSFLKARRYARERGANGSHTIEQWSELKVSHGNRCALCKEEKPLTKDHIIPLSKGGSDYIANIQPLCRNCNSRKWATVPIHENPELLS